MISLYCGQGNGTGDVADICSTAAESPEDTGAETPKLFPEKEEQLTPTMTTMVPPSIQLNANDSILRTEFAANIHRSESYRHIIEAAEDEEEEDRNVFFFSRFKSTAKFVNIERVPRSKSIKM